MPFQEFPKGLFLKGWDDLSASVTVWSAEEEAQARAQGYRPLSEPAQEPEKRKPRQKKAE